MAKIGMRCIIGALTLAVLVISPYPASAQLTPAQCGFKNISSFTDGCCPAGKASCNPQTDCFLDFAGHRWWTNYHWQYGDFNGRPGNYFEFLQAWNPQGPFVDGEGLHLRVFKDNLGGGSGWTSSQVVSLTNFGFGTYLVTARIKTVGARSFADLDPNVALGVFTYQADIAGASSKNPNRELDMAEVSRWGYTGGTCNIRPPMLCRGNSQFAVQKWDALAENVQRYDIADRGEITLTMEWNGAGEPVTFRQYNGLFDLQTVKGQKSAHDYTTNTNQNPFIPTQGDCVMFMLNLYLGDYQSNPWRTNPAKPFEPPRNQSVPHEVVVTNFQYSPK